MNKNNHVGLALDELYKMFDQLNKKYFQGLPHPMITIQHTRREGNTGWFTLDEVWESEEIGKKYEINICADYLNRDIRDIAGTLQHEMVHYANKIAEVRDCNGQIHNKKFKKLAELVGLMVEEKSPKYGFGLTHCSEELVNFIDEVIKPDAEAFKYFRLRIKKPKLIVEKFYTYKCVKCDERIKAKEEAEVLCVSCNKNFKRVRE